ncbi:UNVERIFIED_CONTAM: hypothetical protein ABIC26_004783 [Paenibacillus sp. PvR008]
MKALSSHEEIHSAEVISLENHALVSSEYGYVPDWDQAPDTTWVPWIRDIQRKPLLIKRRWYGTNHEHGTVELLSLARPVVKDGQVIGAVLVNLVGEFHRKSLVVERSLPELRSKYIEDVIQRRMGIQEMRMKWEQYFSDWDGSSLAVMIVSNDRYSTWAESFPEEDKMLLKYALKIFCWNGLNLTGRR